jgi:poly(3-hydroxybutyrate) depolymerase
MVCTRVEREGAVRFARARARLGLTGAVTRGAYVSPSLTVARSLLVAFIVACSSPRAPVPPTNASASSPHPERAADAVSTIVARPDLAAYHGWIKYLSFQAQHGVERAARAVQLAEWSAKILENPALLSELRGVHEWAYESAADGSGQPFRISIPASYDGVRAMPLSVYLHGQGANHLEAPQVPEQLMAWSADANFIEVAVLGRARGAGYVGLGEADVLQVIDYVTQHFRADVDRIHLVGVSMGGVGAMELGARHPHRFASVWSVCGSALDIPVANLLTVPIYVTHSDDDTSVPPFIMRGAAEHLPKRGGKAVWDLTTGYGHAVWKYHAGNERARRWTFEQVRPSSAAVRHIDFTALDGNAARAWWAEVEEWGPEPKPARFVLRAEDNTLHVELHNVLALRLHLAQSPLDLRKAISLVLHTGKHTSQSTRSSIEPGSVTDSVVLAIDPDTHAARLAAASSGRSEPSRRHTPGGANLLYDGKPLLIVYGTRGDAATRQAQKAGAELASRNANSGWFEANEARPHTHGLPLRFNVYGDLRVKADVDVSAADVVRHHLVLLGTAEQNSVVERIAERLPVTFSSEHIEFDDGLRVPSTGATLRLVYRNPEAPERLLYWIASNDVRAYGPSGALLQAMALGPHAADALVTVDAEARLVLVRHLDSRWRWLKRERSPLLELEENTWAAADRVQAEAARRAIGANFAVVSSFRTARGGAAFSPGWTRVSDVTPYFAPLSLMQVTGRELLAAAAAFDEEQRTGADDYVSSIWPVPSAQAIEPDRTYTLVAPPDGVYELPVVAHVTPRKLELTDTTLADVVDASSATLAP